MSHAAPATKRRIALVYPELGKLPEVYSNFTSISASSPDVNAPFAEEVLLDFASVEPQTERPEGEERVVDARVVTRVRMSPQSAARLAFTLLQIMRIEAVGGPNQPTPELKPGEGSK